MGSYRVLGASVVAAAVAACGGAPKSGTTSSKAQVDSGAVLEVKAVGATVLGVTEAMPKCPVTARWEATLGVFKVSGPVQYRWERSDSVNSKTMEVMAPASAMTQSTDVAIIPYEWQDTVKGVQQDRWVRVHILSPINSQSAPIDAQSKCY